MSRVCYNWEPASIMIDTWQNAVQIPVNPGLEILATAIKIPS